MPFAAGETSDLLGRALAENLAKVVGQTVVVENLPGARGKLGTEFAVRAPADGYTLLLATSTHAANASLFNELSYDAVKDFAPVTLIATVPYVLAVHPNLPVRTLNELITFGEGPAGIAALTSRLSAPRASGIFQASF